MKYDEAYKNGMMRLEETGIMEASLDARLLLEHVCHTDRNTLLLNSHRELSADEEQNFSSLITQRARHVPLQHLTGTWEFMGLEYFVDSTTLIPRQDTETLVEEALLYLHDGMRVLDLCTGSGCVLLSLMHYSNDVIGVGTDISEGAVKLAKRNAEKHNLQPEILQGDLFESVTGKFDMIVSNPPYIQSETINTLMAEVRDYEPIEALDGGIDGLDFYRRIAKESGSYLSGGGCLLLEIGYDESEAVCELLSKAGFTDIKTVKDLAGNERVVSAVLIGG